VTANVDVNALRVAVTPRGSTSPRVVLRSVDLSLPAGQVTCIVGESGSGKTLLMRSLLGISPARPGVTRGQATCAVGDARHDLLGRRLLPPGTASYVFQHAHQSLDPFRTVGSQVVDSVKVAHPEHDRAALWGLAVHWLARVQLPDAEDTARLHPHELSGGMAQRVAIAVALATEPELLVADEPTTGLDWSVRREVVELLLALREERGMTMVLISHDFQVVEFAADRVIVMLGGEIVEEGPRSLFFGGGGGQHPYSAALQGRAIALSEGRLMVGEGSLEPQPGAGCPHANSCVRRRAATQTTWAVRCQTEIPALKPLAEGHSVRCWAPEDPA
jgi:ABC-type dipeptide/oligopeptide/nickel transport system ATPase component